MTVRDIGFGFGLTTRNGLKTVHIFRFFDLTWIMNAKIFDNGIWGHFEHIIFLEIYARVSEEVFS